ncbi:MAG TPA: hypothetical protein VGI65_17565 [Steroidobacteraceae bacterium]|jgi:hypothetical protein
MRAAALSCVIVISAWLGAPASAEDIAAARKCSAISDPTARLACFDAAFAVAPAPPAATFGDNVALQQQRAPKVVLPKMIEVKVTQATSLGKGLYRLTLDNGQVWETHEADWTLQFKSSDVITISRLPMGSYQISMPGVARTISARRVQ